MHVNLLCCKELTYADTCNGICGTSHYSSKISDAPEDWHLAEAGELQGDQQHF